MAIKWGKLAVKMENYSQPLSIVEANHLSSQAEVTGFLSLFDKQVIENPSKTALIYKDHSLSYSELAQLSATYASHLANEGVTAGNVITVMLPRSMELIPVLVAIMRLGATYIPIDIKHPVKSIERIINAANPDFAIYNPSTDAIAHDFPQLKHLLIEDFKTIQSKIDGKNIQKIESLRQPAKTDAAYIIYTSGSTGIPKGVRISHHALSCFLLGIQHEINCNKEDKFAALTTISFDISGLEMYLPLTLGATVVIIPQEENTNPYKLAELLNKEKVSILQATPAMYRLLLTGGWTASTYLKKILCGGEALTQELANQLVDSADEVWNVYGPTEATIWATTKKIISHDQAPTIGQPLAGYECLILDENHKPTPVNVAGELYIAGLGLATDYYNNEAKTKEHFFTIDFNGEPKRVYKTGDKALINSNGDIEYLGRLDFQVKVRGYRVELPEIELIANSHPAITEFTAIASKAPSGENIIKGFYTLKADSDCDTDSLHKYLSEHLAHYMLPSMLHELEKMPLNTNGKIDRKALAEITSKVELSPITAPSDSTYSKDFEFYIYRAWCETLGVSDCNPDDNFFLTGGSSLSAMQFIRRVEQLTNNKIPLGLLFKEPKLDDFLEALRKINSKNASIKVPLNQSAKEDSGDHQFYFICGINIYQHVADNLEKNTEAHAIFIEDERKIVEENAAESKTTSTQILAAIYVDSILDNLKDKKISLCGISYGGLLAIEVANQLQQKNINADCVYMLDSSLPGALRTYRFKKTYREVQLKFFHTIEKILNFLCLNKLSSKYRLIVKNKYMRSINDDIFEAATNATNVDHIDFSGEVVLMRAKNEGGFWHKFKNKPDYGWQNALNREIQTFKIPGDHLGIINKENAVQVANIINTQMKTHND